MTSPQQPYLGSDYAPPHDPNIESALLAWHTAKLEAKRAAEDKKRKHAAALLHIQHAGLEAYPWTNPDNGRKRTIKITSDLKLKEGSAPREGRRGGKAELGDAAERKARKQQREEEKVEVRRVPRESVEKELDPFAATRAAMEKGKAEKAVEKPEAKHAKPKATRKR